MWPITPSNYWLPFLFFSTVSPLLWVKWVEQCVWLTCIYIYLWMCCTVKQDIWFCSAQLWLRTSQQEDVGCDVSISMCLALCLSYIQSARTCTQIHSWTCKILSRFASCCLYWTLLFLIPRSTGVLENVWNHITDESESNKLENKSSVMT